MDGSRIFGPLILEVELWATWAGIVYARLTLQANKLMIEDDSFTNIGRIQSYTKGAATHPLL